MNIPRLHLDPLTPSAVTTPPCSQHAFNAQIKVQSETPCVLLISVPFQPVECSEWIVVYLATQTQAQHICSAFKSKTHTALHSCGTERNQSVNLFSTAVKLEFGLLVYFVLLVQVFAVLIRTKEPVTSPQHCTDIVFLPSLPSFGRWSQRGSRRAPPGSSGPSSESCEGWFQRTTDHTLITAPLAAASTGGGLRRRERTGPHCTSGSVPTRCKD